MENEKYNICHSVRVYKTTLVKSSHLKAGGKTSNTPRVEPLHPEIYKRIMERKTYIESIVSFPLYDKEGKKYETINSLPIVCVDNNYAERCNGFILTETGRNFLRNEMSIARNRYNGISELLLSNSEIIEKDATTYLFRRNFATMARYNHLDEMEIKYLMGHDLEDDFMSRNDFLDDDFQFNLYQKISKINFATQAQF